MRMPIMPPPPSSSSANATDIKKYLRSRGLPAHNIDERCYCTCTAHCLAYRHHPLGRHLSGRECNQHLLDELEQAEEFRRQRQRDGGGRMADDAVAGLVRRAVERPGRFLVALGSRCKTGKLCHIRVGGTRVPRYWKDQCHAIYLQGVPTEPEHTCTARLEEGTWAIREAPFAALVRWKPEDGAVEWTSMFEWVDELPDAATEPREEPAQPPTPPAPGHASPTTQPPAPTPRVATEAPVASTSRLSPPARAADSDSAPPPKRPRLSAARQEAAAAFLAQLEVEQQAEDDARAAKEEEAARMMAQRDRDRKILARYKARLDEYVERNDPTAALASWDACRRRIMKARTEGADWLIPGIEQEEGLESAGVGGAVEDEGMGGRAAEAS